MITSKYIIELTEKYNMLYNPGSGQTTTVIFENPTSSDFQDMVKTSKDGGRTLFELRFIADNKDSKVYVADSWYVLHDQMKFALGFPPDSSFEKTPWLFDGVATYSGGKARMTTWDKFDVFITDRKHSSPELNEWIEETLYAYKWGWVDKYIGGFSSVLDSYKEKYKKFIKAQK
jgi:hypothetical protein